MPFFYIKYPTFNDHFVFMLPMNKAASNVRPIPPLFMLHFILLVYLSFYELDLLIHICVISSTSSISFVHNLICVIENLKQFVIFINVMNWYQY
jgi:hypothetical protein